MPAWTSTDHCHSGSKRGICFFPPHLSTARRNPSPNPELSWEARILCDERSQSLPIWLVVSNLPGAAPFDPKGTDLQEAVMRGART